MKKNKLYTISPWNRQAFVKVEPLPAKNLFDGENMSTQQMNNNRSGIGNFSGQFQTINPNQANFGTGAASVSYSPTLPQNTGTLNINTGGANGGGKKSKGMSSTAQQAIALGASALGSINTGERRGMWDTLDPIHHLAGGRETGFGNALGDAGVKLTEAGLASGNYYLAIAGAAAKGVGGLINAGWGYNIENEQEVKDNIAHLKNVSVVDGDLDSIQKQYAQAGIADIDVGDVKNGWFNNKGDEEAEKLTNQQDYYKTYAEHMFTNAANNYKQDQLFNALKQWSLPGSRPNQTAYGGPLDIIGNTENDMSAVNYGFMSDYLTEKKRQNDLKNKMAGMTQMPSFMSGYAFGGDLQSNGSDFPSGLVHVKAGGSHEENPYEGVQMGVDPQGTPNLVEEGETVWNDYVFSTRISIDDETKKKFHIGKKREMTYADLSKKLEKEVSERPNDPISQAAFKVQMANLAEQQERQKQEMETARAREAFEALSDEEKVALLEQMANGVNGQNVVEETPMQPSPEEVVLPEDAAAEQQPTEQTTPEVMEPQVMAEGGKVNKFAGTQPGSNRMLNAGTWKSGTSAENWNRYTRNGLRDYLLKINDDIAAADTEEKKNQIRQDAINTVRGIQQAYSEAYQQNLTPSEINEKVRALQTAFQNAGGNAYFSDIADNILLPKGHNTEDTEEKGWIDGLWGPRTSIRNWGSTEYGDDYDDIRQLAQEAGLTYAPGQYTYGDNTLYELSMAQPDAVAPAHENGPEAAWNYGDPTIQRDANGNPVNNGNVGTTGEDELDVAPVLRNENWRYAGLLGPAVGLGMQALGIGKPDTSGIEAAASGAGNYITANWMPIGDYMRPKVFDRLFYANQLQANSRATDRNLMNTSGGNRGTAQAAMLANSYNTQLGLGNLYRQGEEYNDARYKEMKDFNRTTNKINADAYNRNQEFNASAFNDAARSSAQMKLHAAQAKMDADAGWGQSIYGNVAGLFKGISDIGRENAQRNMIARLAASGALPGITPNNAMNAGLVRYLTDEEKARRNAQKVAAKGGKIKRKKGFTY